MALSTARGGVPSVAARDAFCDRDRLTSTSPNEGLGGSSFRLPVSSTWALMLASMASTSFTLRFMIKSSTGAPTTGTARCHSPFTVNVVLPSAGSNVMVKIGPAEDFPTMRRLGTTSVYSMTRSMWMPSKWENRRAEEPTPSGVSWTSLTAQSSKQAHSLPTSLAKSNTLSTG